MDQTLTSIERDLNAVLVLIADRLVALALGNAGRLAPVFLLASLLLAYGIWLWRRPQKGFLAWALPREIWFHRSHWVDIKLIVFTRLSAALGRIAAIATSTGLAAWVSHTVEESIGRDASAPGAINAAVLYFVTADFCAYCVHRFSHLNAVFWPFHAVHHSAEVLTPFTVYRKHPVYNLVEGITLSAMLGLVSGLVLGLTLGEVGVATLAGINVIYYAFDLLGANLRHSHIWLSFGPVIEHLVISPAQHQIHHSTDPRHLKKNYGEALAIWDWMFGSLYVTHGEEKLTFGLTDLEGRSIVQPHATLRALLLEPFVASWRVLQGRLRRRLRFKVKEPE
jgi:sterol desaturase/sphingolipid hydroxylase (fatty acid hydroxylase superfamily)